MLESLVTMRQERQKCITGAGTALMCAGISVHRADYDQINLRRAMMPHQLSKLRASATANARAEHLGFVPDAG